MKQARCAICQRACFIIQISRNLLDGFCSSEYADLMENNTDQLEPATEQTAAAPVLKSDSPPPRRRRLGRWIKAILLLLFLLIFPLVIETYHHCVICGMRHTEWRIIGIGWLLSSRNRSTPCSDWYQAEVEPEHQHVWGRVPYAEGRNVFGMQAGMYQDGSLASGPFNLLLLGHHKQLAIYQSAPDPAQARGLFLKLARFAPAGSPEEQTQDEIFARFWEWIRSGMQGPWPFKEEEFLTPAGHKRGQVSF